MKSKKEVFIQFRVDEDLHRKIKEEAKKEGRTIYGFLGNLLQAGMKKYSKNESTTN